MRGRAPTRAALRLRWLMIAGALVAALPLSSPLERTRRVSKRDQRSRILAVVREINQILARVTLVERVLPDVLSELGPLLQSNAIVLFELSDTGSILAPRAVWSQRELAPLVESFGAAVALHDDAAGRGMAALRAGQPVTLSTDSPQNAGRPLLGMPSGAAALVPVFKGVLWCGVLVCIDRTSTRVWSSDELDLLMTVADMIGVAVERQAVQASLGRSEQRFAALLRALPGITVLMRRDGHVDELQAPPGDRLLLPYDQANASIYALAPAALASQLVQAAQAALERRETQQFEYALPQRLGDILLAERQLAPETLYATLQLQRARSEQGQRILLGDLLVERGYLSAHALDNSLRLQHMRRAVSDYEVRVMASGADDVICIIREITPYKRTAQQARLQLQRAELRAELAQALDRVGLDYEQMPGIVTQQVASALGGACVMHMRDEQDQLVLVAHFHPDAAVRAEFCRQLPVWVELCEHTLLASVLQSGHSVLEPYAGLWTPEGGTAGGPPAALRVSSLMAVALPVRGHVLGALTVARIGPGVAYQADDLSLLEDLAARAALAIGDAHLFRATQQLGEDIKRSRDLLRTLFDSMDDGMLLVDSTGRVLASNQTLARMLGWPVGRLMEMVWHDICAHIGLDAGPKWLATALCTGQVFQERVRIEPSSGAAAIVDVRLLPPARSQPQFDLCIIQIVDVTERVQLEVQLLETERFAASGRLAATVAHEINTPLQSVQAFLYLLNGAAAPQRQAYVDLALQEIDRIARIVKQLLELYRSGAALTTMVDLNSVIERVLLLIDHTVAQQRVLVMRDLAPALPMLWGRADQLTQMLVHLLVNAVQASPQGGRVTVRTSVSTAQECRLRQIGVGPDQLVAIVDVADSGPGISPEAQAHVFEPFYPGRAGGTGLSLAICAQVVAEHRGAISVHSELAQGSQFRVVLPIYTDSGLQVRA